MAPYRLVGCHVRGDADVLAEAAARDVGVVQIFLHPPQTWKVPAERDDAATLRDSDLKVYVHAPYLINVASANNRVRIPSRKILQDTCDAAAEVGATAVLA